VRRFASRGGFGGWSTSSSWSGTAAGGARPQWAASLAMSGLRSWDRRGGQGSRDLERRKGRTSLNPGSLSFGWSTQRASRASCSYQWPAVLWRASPGPFHQVVRFVGLALNGLRLSGNPRSQYGSLHLWYAGAVDRSKRVLSADHHIGPASACAFGIS